MLRLLLLLAAMAPAAAAQPATVVGTVTDETGFPIPGANVYLSGTTHGDATNERGRFEIRGVAPGAYRVIASMLGFETVSQSLHLAGGDWKSVRLKMTETGVEIGTASVEVERDRQWESRLARFTQILIGESANADSTRILNPEVLDFRSSWGNLTATARAPLIIENRALGYRLRYDLQEFEAGPRSIRYRGDEIFEALIPRDADEASRWEAARQRAYRGSLAHLFRALLEGTAEDEGFTLYHAAEARNTFPGSGETTSRASADQVLTAADYGWGTLRFGGQIDVVYDREPEEPAYLDSQWFRETRQKPNPVQSSSLHITETLVRVDPQGTPEDPTSLTTSGYMGFERLADRVPEDYVPPAE